MDPQSRQESDPGSIRHRTGVAQWPARSRQAIQDRPGIDSSRSGPTMDRPKIRERPGIDIDLRSTLWGSGSTRDQFGSSPDPGPTRARRGLDPRSAVDQGSTGSRQGSIRARPGIDTQSAVESALIRGRPGSIRIRACRGRSGPTRR